MKQILIIGSVAVAVTGAAIILFRCCRRSKKEKPPGMTFDDLYRDNCNGGEKYWS